MDVGTFFQRVVVVSVVCLLLYFLLRELVQYRKDNKRLDYDDVALVACVMFIG